MASVEIARLAREELAELVATRSLPGDTEGRVWRSLLTLALAGKALDGYWLGYRWVVGPWRWLIIVYRYVEREDRVVVIGFRAGRSASPALSGGR